MTDDNDATKVADETRTDPLYDLTDAFLEWLRGSEAFGVVADAAIVQDEPDKHVIAGFLLDGRPVSLMLNWTE